MQTHLAAGTRRIHDPMDGMPHDHHGTPLAAYNHKSAGDVVDANFHAAHFSLVLTEQPAVVRCVAAQPHPDPMQLFEQSACVSEQEDSR